MAEVGRITGTVEILVNGQPLLNKAGASASGIGLSGEPNYELKQIMGDTGPHGTTEEPVEAKCEVTISDRSDILLSDLAQIRENGTVIFRSRGKGKVYTMTNATCMRNFTVTAGEGEVSVTFVGPYWTEGTY
jgi:hypothetical protein